MLHWLATHWAEIVGFGTGAACVLLASYRKIWTFPVGIVNNLVFIVLFVSTGIYANAGLQVVYLALGLHGWRNWHAQQGQPEFVLRMPRAAIPALVGAGVAATTALTWLLSAHTDSTVPFVDAATTSVSLVAQYMLNRRWLECWIVWIVVDIAYVALYFSVGLPITAALYVLFIGLCVQGMLSWRMHRRQTDAAAIA
ncbi:putative PnuC family transporter [Gordonia effusa NBRC 100432]|uniref:Putative PnuC family transporter n=1 Tax=Gordonia effusa NBRC 100432 TaxID=1077974 RepID=H0QUW6_9ACTN|nr:nicotinamide riboside transporter PnuC [Gordonia effusa]GAB16617.1 putative PnuC family transporter [Gordonia effusa NBRC 100432]